MPYPNGHKTNSAGGSRRSTTGGRRPAHRVQGSAFGAWDLDRSIANCKLWMARPSPLTPLPKVEGTISRGHRETASGFLHPSSFILHPSSYIAHPSSFRRGVTLVEMLIVIFIIVILTAASLKLITPGEDRRVREAARAVNVYLSSARSRAIETGRPCGVIFHRASGTNFPSAATVLDQCEVPPTYAGDVTNSEVLVGNYTHRPDGYTYFADGRIVLKVRIKDNQFASNLIRPGDLIQFNGQGPFFTLVYDDPAGSLRTQPPYTNATPPPASMNPPTDPPINDFMPVDIKDNTLYDPNGYYNFKPSGLAVDANGWITSHWLTVTLNQQETPVQALPWGFFSPSPPFIIVYPVPFVIIRQPVKTAAESLQLPAGSVVDLDFSGTEPKSPVSVSPPVGSYYVAVMFSSAGAIDSFYENNTRFGVSGPIYLLVGSRSRVRDFVAQPITTVPNKKYLPTNLNELPNWAELSSLWVMINYQTGLVSTDENYAINFAAQKDNEIPPKLIDWTIAPNWNYSNSSNWGFFVYLSRTYARQSQSMGGR
jgi:prepilin-type N-terminal cleavage/methylation domain-containing protein